MKKKHTREKHNRKAITFRLPEKTIATIKALAELHKTSQGRVIEALLITYGSKLLKDDKS